MQLFWHKVGGETAQNSKQREEIISFNNFIFPRTGKEVFLLESPTVNTHHPTNSRFL